MLTKFESKSNRVKGLAFHSKRPWILAALHNGSIQWWDYRMGTLLDRFDEHEGPVRGVAFHLTQPLFVSGGDDYKIKVWNHKQRRCLFTLQGHLDFVRTVQFHHQQPWILSSSDDHTIRIWNWQSRNCISIVTGHNHYVMCAQFHPKDDLIVSASLDFTIRVWDFSGLKKKHSAPGTSHSFEDQRQQGQDMFGNMDVVVKYVLEGHDKGINWVSFHPTLPLIVSGADDRQIKVWRMSETKAWEVDTFRGHYNNISSVCFHSKQELIISDSEDKTIRVWDMAKRTIAQTFRREHDRFWVLTAHPELNLFAAGHDNGLLVFKLERERPAFVLHQNSLFYVKDKALRHYDFTSGDDTSIAVVKRGKGYEVSPRYVSFNPTEKSVLVSVPLENGMIEYYQLDGERGGFRETSSEPKKFTGWAAIYIARNRFAVLEKARQHIVVYDSKNGAKVKEVKLSSPASEIFYAGIGHVLVASATNVQLWDMQQGAMVSEMTAAAVKYVAWAPDMSMVALLSKHTIIIAKKSLEQLSQIHETIRIKSAVWDDCGVLVYTTLNHIKYTLSQGDNGIIRTLEHPLYVTRISGNTVFCLDREAKMRLITIDPTEYRFKLALVRRDYDQVLNIINNSNLVGQSIISYLQKKGYPEVALHFVQEPSTRFELALECGNLDVALESAKVLDKAELWYQLANEALRQGDLKMVEGAYQRVKAFERLSFLYLASGNQDKLRKMMRVAEMRGDVMSCFQNALLLGNVEERIKILRSSNQHSLAYLLAKSHGFDDIADEICMQAQIDPQTITGVAAGSLMTGPIPLLPEPDANWPTTTAGRGYFDGGVSAQDANNGPAAGGFSKAAAEEASGWGVEEDGAAAQEAAASNIPMSEDEGEGWGLDELDLKVGGHATASPALSAGASATDQAVLPMQGPSPRQQWARNSSRAIDHIAAGLFDSAMQILNRQLGIHNFAVLKPYFLATAQATTAYLSALPGSPALALPLHGNPTETDALKLLPRIPNRLAQLKNEDLPDAFRHTASNRLPEARDAFVKILHSLLFVACRTATDLDEVRSLVALCREYILGLSIELERRSLGEDAQPGKRCLELAAYFTHCQLQPAHLQIALRSAMTLAYKAQNFSTAATFARRLLELNPPAKLEQTTRQLINLCEQNPQDAIALDYDPLGYYLTCAGSHTPIARGEPVVTCSYSGATYKQSFKGSLCRVSNLTKVGNGAPGLVSPF
ncbi:hypothetical protein RI367_004280 [Sorochytrium milnesiophthora]